MPIDQVFPELVSGAVGEVLGKLLGPEDDKGDAADLVLAKEVGALFAKLLLREDRLSTFTYF